MAGGVTGGQLAFEPGFPNKSWSSPFSCVILEKLLYLFESSSVAGKKDTRPVGQEIISVRGCPRGNAQSMIVIVSQGTA